MTLICHTLCMIATVVVSGCDGFDPDSESLSGRWAWLSEDGQEGRVCCGFSGTISDAGGTLSGHGSVSHGWTESDEVSVSGSRSEGAVTLLLDSGEHTGSIVGQVVDFRGNVAVRGTIEFAGRDAAPILIRKLGK